MDKIIKIKDRWLMFNQTDRTAVTLTEIRAHQDQTEVQMANFTTLNTICNCSKKVIKCQMAIKIIQISKIMEINNIWNNIISRDSLTRLNKWTIMVSPLRRSAVIHPEEVCNKRVKSTLRPWLISNSVTKPSSNNSNTKNNSKLKWKFSSKSKITRYRCTNNYSKSKCWDRSRLKLLRTKKLQTCNKEVERAPVEIKNSIISKFSTRETHQTREDKKTHRMEMRNNSKRYQMQVLCLHRLPKELLLQPCQWQDKHMLPLRDHRKMNKSIWLDLRGKVMWEERHWF